MWDLKDKWEPARELGREEIKAIPGREQHM